MCGVDFRVEPSACTNQQLCPPNKMSPVDQGLKRDAIKIPVLWNRNCGWENSRPTVLAAGPKL
jgi:hypothetical protein